MWQPASDIARQFQITPGTVWLWAWRGFIRQRGRRGSLLYQVPAHIQPPPSHYETAKQGAWRLHTTVRQIHSWGERGRVPHWRINKRVVRYDLSHPPSNPRLRKFTPATLAELARLRARGLTIAALARHFAVSHTAIAWHLKKNLHPIQEAA